MSDNPFSSPDPNNPNQPGQSRQPQYGQQPGYAQSHGVQGSQGSKYGTQSYQPGSYGGPVSEPAEYRRLLSMTLAVLGLYVLIGVIGLVSTFSGETQALVQDELTGAGMSQADVDSAMGLVSGIAGIFAVIVLLVIVGLHLLVYFGLRAEKNWARVTGIVLAILGLLFNLGSLLTGLGNAFATPLMTVTTVLTLIWAAAVIYWLILAFNSTVAGYLQQAHQA